MKKESSSNPSSPISTQDELDQICINTIRFLAVDAVQKANSGHPGAPMGLAALAYTLWTRHLRFNPKNPDWFNRDRFVLSNGHASMLIYALFYLTGYDLSLEALKQFRQWGSKTAGHPERGLTPGVEVTTGPLGQGFANGVGMAVAEQFLRSTFNTPGQEIIDHYTYMICGDGCLEEGITSEAASFAGHHQLGKLICFYDSNHITIDGDTRLTFTEDVHKRFEAYSWQVLEVHDASTNIEAIDHAIRLAKAELDRPSLIICHTHIGYGSPNRQDSPKAHGNPLGKDEIILTKEHLGWPTTPDFYVPEPALEHFRNCVERGAAWESEWNARTDAFESIAPEQSRALRSAIAHKLVDGWDSALPAFVPTDGPMATRIASSKVLNAMAPAIPTLIGGSADLNESTFTKLEAYPEFEPSELYGGEFAGRTINFGIREHAMGAIVNGMAAHGGIWPYGATFFCFSDYMRPVLRLSALMNIPSIFVWTHDSVGLGEDGPTHQPIEHLMSIRGIPHYNLIRPADANETREAWKVAMEASGPTGFALTRQKLPIIDQNKYAKASGLRKGAYILSEPTLPPQLILIATGSEVSLALDAQTALEKEGIYARVVSMPSFKLFEDQSVSYQQQVLPDSMPYRLSIELGISQGWERWVGAMGASLAIDHFGTSAPYEKILQAFGFTTENVVRICRQLLLDPKSLHAELRAFCRTHPLGHA